MPNLLHLLVSARAEKSHSRAVGQELVKTFAARLPNLRIVERDLGGTSFPLPDGCFMEASLMSECDRGPAQYNALGLSEALIGELETADSVVISSPMHNFTVPAALKAWIDYVVRPRRTFQSTPEGKVGLVADRPVYVVVTCGGSFGKGPADQTDFFSPYLRYALGSIGIRTVNILRLENLNRGSEYVRRATGAARAWIDLQVQEGCGGESIAKVRGRITLP
jgi:FMN-dependent NADH-azoreductase